MRSITFNDGDLVLDWVYDTKVIRQEVVTRLGTANAAYSRYVLITTLDSKNNPVYEVVQADPNYGCDLRYLLSTPESNLDELTISNMVETSLSLDPRVSLLSCSYIGSGQISVQYSYSNTDFNLEQDIVTI